MINSRRLFVASCLALVTTAMVFSIRSDILDALGVDFRLNREQLGILLSPAFWGFTVSIVLGGALVDFFGMRRLLLLAAAGYVASVSSIILAPLPKANHLPYYTDPGFILVYAGMLTLGLSQGLVEGVINPLCATIYSKDKARKFAILHSWWPAGMMVGGLLAFATTKLMDLEGPISPFRATLGWRIKLSLILFPAVGFALLTIGQKFPETERVAAGISHRDMVRAVRTPMFLLYFVLMWMTSATEQAPGQWVGSVVTNLTGNQGILVLVYTAGIVFCLRFFAGNLIHKFSPAGILTISAVMAAVGIYSLGSARNSISVFAAATLFGAGTSFFWPVMLSTTSERFPATGALGLSIMAGTGQLATAFVLPVMGRWYDRMGAAATFKYVSAIPAFLAVAFTFLFFYYRAKGGYQPIALSEKLIEEPEEMRMR